MAYPWRPNWRFDEILPELTRRTVRYIQGRAKNDAPFFLYFAMTSPHEPVAPSKQFAGKSGIAPIADFLMETDWSAGQVIQAIDEAGIADNTIVIFTGWETGMKTIVQSLLGALAGLWLAPRSPR